MIVNVDIMFMALVPLLLAVPAQAHVTCWHPAMYGYDPDDFNSVKAADPLMGKTFDQWWFHGDIDKPPADGQYLEIPSGGEILGQCCNRKSETPWGGNHDSSLHAVAFNTHLGVPTQMGEIKGAGWAIAYESDVTKIQPEDFVMISTNQSAPYWRETIYGFPAGLPPCPQGGCHCAWVWIHSPVGGGQEMYMTGYRCMVMNADPNAKPLAKPQVARKCPYDKNNCTIGAKQPHYWYQQERNNNFQDAMDPPYYNHEYGLYDGPQPDIWLTDDKAEFDSSDTGAPAPLYTITDHTFTTIPYTGTFQLPATETPAAFVPGVTTSGLGTLSHTRADQAAPDTLYPTGIPTGPAAALEVTDVANSTDSAAQTDAAAASTADVANTTETGTADASAVTGNVMAVPSVPGQTDLGAVTGAATPMATTPLASATKKCYSKRNRRRVL